MHIEISSGGLGGSLAITEYQSNIASFVSTAENMISSFKAVQKATCDLSGGIGNLEDALDHIEARIQAEEEKVSDAVLIQQKSNDFLDLAVRVDKQVSALVKKNKEEFYRVNPWLKPPEASTEKEPLYKQAWDWLCGVGEAVAESAAQAWDWVKDTASKAWTGLVNFYNEHKKIIDTVLIIVGAIGAIAAVVASGGVALVPLLSAMGVSASAAAAISTTVAVVAVVSTVASGTLNVIDTWAEIDDPTFNAWQKGLNITSAVTNLVYSVGNLYNSFKGINPKEFVANQTTSGAGIGSSKPQFSSLDDMSQNEFDCISKYNVDSASFNDPIRSGKTTSDTKLLSKMISERQLTSDKKLFRIASLDDLKSLDISNIDDFVGTPNPFGKPNTFQGFMSTSADIKLPQYVSHGNVSFQFSAPQGIHALDLSNVMFNEVIFDSPKYTVDLIQKIGNNYKIFATLLP